jgi:hypothetical protein
MSVSDDAGSQSLQNEGADVLQRRSGVLWNVIHWTAIACSVAAILVSILAVLRVDSLISTGPEGGWLACLYAKVLFGVAAAINCMVLAASVFWKKHRPAFLVVQVLVAMVPALLLWWVIGHDSRRAAISPQRESCLCLAPMQRQCGS